MRILVADAFPKEHLAALAPLGLEVIPRPDVPAQDREAFRKEYAAFVEAAKSGKARPETIQSLQKKIVEALKDEAVARNILVPIPMVR